MWDVRLAGVLVVVAATAGAVYAGSPEADRAVQQGVWVGCCGLPLIFGSLVVMCIVIGIRDARKPK
jgi:hypothetical protein